MQRDTKKKSTINNTLKLNNENVMKISISEKKLLNQLRSN